METGLYVPRASLLQPSPRTYPPQRIYIKLQATSTRPNHSQLKSFLWPWPPQSSRCSYAHFTSNVVQISYALQHTSPSACRRSLFRVMFMTAFYGFFRIGELSCATKKQVVTILQFDHLTFLKQSSQVTAVKIVITKFKHNTNNRPFVITIQSKPSETFCPGRPHSTTLNFGLTKKAPCSRVQMAGQSRPIILSSVVL